MKRHKFFVAAAVMLLAASSALVQAAPYASGIVKSGTTVNFILNQDADVLTYSLNGGSPIAMPDGLSKGPHTFTLGAPTDTFSIVADKTEDGWTTTDGGTILPAANHFSQPTAQSNSSNILISSDANPLNHFNSPRGVAVSMDPNAPNFGTTYITNSQVGTPAGRTALGKGLYALKADQTDAYGYGDVSKQDASFTGASANSPFHLSVGQGGLVYVSGYSDVASNVYRVQPDMTNASDPLLAGVTGPTALPPGQNHGSVIASVVLGSSATSNLVVYTLDEDLTTNQVTGSGSTTNTNSVWRYDINGAATPFAGMPTNLPVNTIGGFQFLLDMDRGADGKIYVAQRRSQPANSPVIFVLDPNGVELYNSLTASRALFPAQGDYNSNGFVDAADYPVWRKNQGILSGATAAQGDGDGDGDVDADDYTVWRSKFGSATPDFYSEMFAMAVSPDQKWIATLHNDNTIVVTPLVNGIPDMANRLAIPTTGTVSARDIGFDAAGNIHYVSSGQALYRVLAPGGHTVATTSWNGSSYAFNIATIPGSGSLGGSSVPEPSTLGLLVIGMAGLAARRRKR